MAQAQLPVFPEHDFLHWNTRETLFIEGYKLLYNKVHTKNDGTKVHYFYCSRKVELGCKKSTRAVKEIDGNFSLVGYSGMHCGNCIPSPAFKAVLMVKAAMKARVLSDPTEKPTQLYNSEVNKVRDDMGKCFICKQNLVLKISVF